MIFLSWFDIEISHLCTCAKYVWCASGCDWKWLQVWCTCSSNRGRFYCSYEQNFASKVRMCKISHLRTRAKGVMDVQIWPQFFLWLWAKNCLQGADVRNFASLYMCEMRMMCKRVRPKMVVGTFQKGAHSILCKKQPIWQLPKQIWIYR